MSQFLRVTRPDGVVGVGLLADWCGRPALHALFPDNTRACHREEEAKLLGLSIEPVQLVPIAPPVVPYTAGDDASKQAAIDQINAQADGNEDQLPETPPGDQKPQGADNPEGNESPNSENLSGDQKPESDKTEPPKQTEADAIRAYVAENPTATNKQVIEALAAKGVHVNSTQVSRARK